MGTLFKGAITSEQFSLGHNLMGLLYGNSASGYFEWNKPLWFLPCLVIVEIIWFGVLKITEQINNKHLRCLLFLSVMGFSITWMSVSSNKSWVFPFEFESALGMLFFFGLGLICRNDIIESIIKVKDTRKRAIAFVIGLSATIVLSQYNFVTAARTEMYGNVVIYILNAIFAAVFVFSLALIIGRNSIAEYIGKRTLAILVMHKFPIMFFELFFPFFRNGVNNQVIVIELLETAIVIVMCLLSEKMISCFVPEVFGRSRYSWS